MTFKYLSTLLLFFVFVTPAQAQSDQQILQHLHQTAALVRTKAATARDMAGIYSMAQNSQGYQLCQYELQYHQDFFNYLEQLARNPGALRNQGAAEEFDGKYWEYCYRTERQDYRPREQAQPAFQQWKAQKYWEASTPAGRQAFQNRLRQQQANFDNSQANHRQRTAAFDSYMNGLRNTSTQNDKNQHQYVNTIHDRYEYVNPYDGQGYLYSNTETGNPRMENPDGSITTLVPYEKY